MPEETTFMQKVKNNPIKTAISICTLIGMIVTAVITVDARYLKAGAIEEYANDNKRLFIQHQIDDIKRELFGLNFKVNNNTASPLDRAMRDELNGELRQKEMELNNVGR